MNAREKTRRRLASMMGKIIRHLDASGVQLPADLLGYKTFRKRETLEQKLLRKIRGVYQTHTGKVLELLGDPPRVENLTGIFWDQETKELIAAIAPLLIETQLEQAQEILDDNPAIGVDWAAINREAIDWARDYTFDLVKGINETSKELLQTSVSSYFENDLTRGELEDLISGAFSETRAEMIAVTEITRAASQGELEVWKEIKEQGIEMVASWVTDNDELVCDICGSFNEKDADGDDGEPSDNYNGEGPYWIYEGENYQPPAHPRCRCAWTMGFKEEK